MRFWSGQFVFLDVRVRKVRYLGVAAGAYYELHGAARRLGITKPAGSRACSTIHIISTAASTAAWSFWHAREKRQSLPSDDVYFFRVRGNMWNTDGQDSGQ